jgi:hypothetical protein
VSQPSPVAAGCTGGAVSGQAFVHSEVEPWLAIDRNDARRVLGAWQQDRWSNGSARALVSASSSDGGASWQMHLHPMSRCGGAAPGSSGDFERVTDPWVDFSPDGTAYVMGLATIGPSLVDGSQSAMLVSRSSDGGRTWSAPLALIHDFGLHHNDKNTLTADPLDAAFVYAVWNRNARDGNGQTMLARSSDGGRTWEAARAIVEPRAFAPSGATLARRGAHLERAAGGEPHGQRAGVHAGGARARRRPHRRVALRLAQQHARCRHTAGRRLARHVRRWHAVERDAHGRAVRHDPSAERGRPLPRRLPGAGQQRQ